MRGPVGSDITMTLQREGTPDPFDVKITRETITISPVKSRLEDGVVVLRLTTFNEQTYPELEKQLKERGRGRRRHGQGHRLRPRPAQQPRRPAQPGDLGGRRLPRLGRDRLDPRPRPARQRALQRRRRATSTDGKPMAVVDQRRLGQRLGDRRRRAEGPPPRGDHRHPELRQGLGADDHAGAGRGRDPADHGALLHAVGPLDPGAGRRARHHRRAAPARGGRAATEERDRRSRTRTEADLRGSLQND